MINSQNNNSCNYNNNEHLKHLKVVLEDLPR